MKEETCDVDTRQGKNKLTYPGTGEIIVTIIPRNRNPPERRGGQVRNLRRRSTVRRLGGKGVSAFAETCFMVVSIARGLWHFVCGVLFRSTLPTTTAR
jgi:hypothetical protein